MKMEKPVRHIAVQIPGKGWTVARVEGSKRTGRKITPLPGYSETYNMHQAQIAADNAQLDFLHGVGVYKAARKSNPRKRMGTQSATRKSSATGKPPSRRLIARRKMNTRKGYFPNPLRQKNPSIARPKSPYVVETSNDKTHWIPIAHCMGREKAINIARARPEGNRMYYRVIKR